MVIVVPDPPYVLKIEDDRYEVATYDGHVVSAQIEYYYKGFLTLEEAIASARTIKLDNPKLEVELHINEVDDTFYV